MTEEQKKVILQAAKILNQIKRKKGVEKVSIPVISGIISFQ